MRMEENPLQLSDVFKQMRDCATERVYTDFFVIQEEAPGILGKDTAVKRGLLKLE